MLALMTPAPHMAPGNKRDNCINTKDKIDHQNKLHEKDKKDNGTYQISLSF